MQISPAFICFSKARQLIRDIVQHLVAPVRHVVAPEILVSARPSREGIADCDNHWENFHGARGCHVCDEQEQQTNRVADDSTFGQH
jgi:hypothetical protein